MTDVPVIDIGIAEADRQAIAEGLSLLLADSYTLYLKTHNYHWNVVGPMFNTLPFHRRVNAAWVAASESSWSEFVAGEAASLLEP